MAKKSKELEIVLSDSVKAKLAKASPAIQESMRDLFAIFRQAAQGIEEGKYKSFPDAIEALTGNRPTRIDTEDDDESNSD